MTERTMDNSGSQIETVTQRPEQGVAVLPAHPKDIEWRTFRAGMVYQITATHLPTGHTVSGQTGLEWNKKSEFQLRDELLEKLNKLIKDSSVNKTEPLQTKKQPTDDDWKREVSQITDPVEMLKCILKNEHFLGYDPYYKDLREAMLNQAEKIVGGG